MTSTEIKETMDSLLRGETFIHDDFYGGELLTFGYDAQKAQYYVQRIDTVVGSYNVTDYHSEAEILMKLKKLL
jgi:hypothetical protein